MYVREQTYKHTVVSDEFMQREPRTTVKLQAVTLNVHKNRHCRVVESCYFVTQNVICVLVMEM